MLLEEDILYEVLITTVNDDLSYNTKPFGVRYRNNLLELELYPNKTLHNIKNNTTFLVQFTSNPLCYVKSFFNLLSDENYDNEGILSGIDCVLSCNVVSFSSYPKNDNYGKTITTKILAKIVDNIEYNKSVPIINRATFNIIELLIDFSRFNMMDIHHKDTFIKKIGYSEKIIKKTGNKNHAQSLKIIKKEFKKRYL